MAGKAPKITLVIAGDGSGAKKALEEVNQHFDQSENKLKKYGKAAGAAMLAGGAAVGLGMGASVKAFADFDAKMTQSLAIMGNVSDAQRKDMSDAAREVAKTTTFSATQAAESYYFLASAGLNAEKSIGAMPRVAAFAQAGMFDMALATDLLTDAQSALGLVSKDTAQNLENMNRVGDVLVKANTLANASVEQFSSALTNKAGAAMKSVGMEVEEGVAVLAAFADQGIKAEEAGTQFGIVLRDLQTKALENADAFKRFGVSVYDSQGELRNVGDIVGELEGALDGMSDAEKKTTLATMGFTDKSIGALLALMGTSEKIKGYEAALRDAGGTMDEVAQKQLQTFWAQLGLLKSQLVDVGLKIGEKLMPYIMELAKRLQENLPAIEAWVDKAIAFAPALLNLVPVLAGVAAGIVALKLGTFVTEISGAITKAGGLGAALTGALGPVGMIALAIAALTAAVVVAYQKSETFREVVDTVWAAVKEAITRAWENAIKPALEALWGFITETLAPALRTFMTFVVEEVWPRISAAVKFAWEKVIKPGLQDLKGFFDTVLLPLFRLVRTVAEEVWSAVSGAVSDAWKKIEPPLEKLRAFVADKLTPVWEIFRGAASTAWGALSSIVNGALRAIGGPISSFLSVIAKVADAIGMDKLAGLFKSAASSVKGWGQTIASNRPTGQVELNQGGLIPGAGPDRDSVLAYLTPGEFVIKRRSAQKLGPALLERLNRIGDIGLFNTGGYVKSPEEVLAWARSMSGPYSLGGFGPNFDCSSAMSAASNYAATGNYRSGGRWATGAAAGYAAALGRFVKGLGPFEGFNIGVQPTVGSAIGHTAGTIAGTNIESSGGRGLHVGGSRGSEYGPYKYHLPGYGGPSEEMKGWFAKIGDLIGLLKNGIGNPVGDMFRSSAETIAKETATFLIDKIPFGGVLTKIVGLGAKIFDQGGILPPGHWLTTNATGSNELVLTPEQSVAVAGSSLADPNDERTKALSLILPADFMANRTAADIETLTGIFLPDYIPPAEQAVVTGEAVGESVGTELETSEEILTSSEGVLVEIRDGQTRGVDRLVSIATDLRAVLDILVAEAKKPPAARTPISQRSTNIYVTGNPGTDLARQIVTALA